MNKLCNIYNYLRLILCVLIFNIYSIAIYAQAPVFADASDVKAIDSMITSFYSGQYTNNLYAPWLMKSHSAVINGNENLRNEIDLVQLDAQTQLNLVYNEDVERYIQLFRDHREKHFEVIKNRTFYYFPLFEQMLDKYNIPLELKYLSVIESALNPVARSKSGAVGLWQFKINTARIVGLNIDSNIDERRDVYKSTEAACKYLSFLHRTFNDWELAVAAYNCGPGEMKKAILRAGGSRDYWYVRQYLPEQTQNYLPSLIATIYVLNKTTSYKIDPKEYGFPLFATDTFLLHQPVTFSHIEQSSGTPVDIIKKLNPSYLNNFIPASKSGNVLILPSENTEQYIINENIYSQENNTRNIRITHTVRSGESFNKLAIIYDCTLDDILNWNNLCSTQLRLNDKLEIWVTPDKFQELRSNSYH